jgi:hypothetical protein
MEAPSLLAPPPYKREEPSSSENLKPLKSGTKIG